MTDSAAGNPGNTQRDDDSLLGGPNQWNSDVPLYSSAFNQEGSLLGTDFNFSNTAVNNLVSQSAIPGNAWFSHTLGAGEATWNAQSAHAYHIGSIDCAPGSASEINGQLHKMFKTLKDVKKYGSEFIETAQNKVRDLQKDIKKITNAIAGILKAVVQRMRNWIMKQIRQLIDGALSSLFPRLMTEIKDSIKIKSFVVTR